MRSGQGKGWAGRGAGRVRGGPLQGGQAGGRWGGQGIGSIAGQGVLVGCTGGAGSRVYSRSGGACGGARSRVYSRSGGACGGAQGGQGLGSRAGRGVPAWGAPEGSGSGAGQGIGQIGGCLWGGTRGVRVQGRAGEVGAAWLEMGVGGGRWMGRCVCVCGGVCGGI